MLAPLPTEPVGGRPNMYVYHSALQAGAFHYFRGHAKPVGEIVTVVHLGSHPPVELTARMDWAIRYAAAALLLLPTRGETGKSGPPLCEFK